MQIWAKSSRILALCDSCWLQHSGVSASLASDPGGSNPRNDTWSLYMMFVICVWISLYPHLPVDQGIEIICLQTILKSVLVILFKFLLFLIWLVNIAVEPGSVIFLSTYSCGYFILVRILLNFPLLLLSWWPHSSADHSDDYSEISLSLLSDNFSVFHWNRWLFPVLNFNIFRPREKRMVCYQL